MVGLDDSDSLTEVINLPLSLPLLLVISFLHVHNSKYIIIPSCPPQK